jgi:N utilization substance protein A
MTDTITGFSEATLDELIPSLAGPTELKVVTATVTSATPDVATLRTAAGVEAYLPVTEFYPNRRWAVGERYQLLQVHGGPRPQLSAVRPELITALLEGLSPEVRDGSVRVMAVARAAGVRAKVAVAATQEGVDAVAACVGRGANRVKALASLLAGERVDVIAWHADRETYLRNALAPAAVERVRFEGTKAIATAPAHMMSAAVGGSGLNSMLAGQLTGYTVVIDNA